ncbi:hypothetical protein GN956_G5459 [Arapaima gigas]
MQRLSLGLHPEGGGRESRAKTMSSDFMAPLIGFQQTLPGRQLSMTIQEPVAPGRALHHRKDAADNSHLMHICREEIKL